MVGGVLTALALAFLLKGLSATRQAPTASISATVMGTVWIGCGLAFVLLLRDLPEHGRLAAFTVVLAVWAGDTLAYLGGRLLGRHRMAPQHLAGEDVGGLRVRNGGDDLRRVRRALQAALPHDRRVDRARGVLAVAAPIGDLFESMLKRDAGVKDAGALLGGHGGMLDRLDALLFAVPAAYFCIAAFG